MASLYKEYFNIDPKYYAAVTADLIEQGKVSWKGFYPHETFVKLLETTYKVLTGGATRSIWVEGSYGTGKSHAALTVKSLVDASTEEIKDYFDDYGLSSDLRDKYISLKADTIAFTFILAEIMLARCRYFFCSGRINIIFCHDLSRICHEKRPSA